VSDIAKKIDELFNKKLDQHAIEVIRSVMEAHIKIRLGSDYNLAVNGVVDEAQIPVDCDTLRRFVKDKNYRNKAQPFNSSPETLKALVIYLTNPDVEELKIEYLERSDYPQSALPLHLSEFFGGAKFFTSAKEYSGTFLSGPDFSRDHGYINKLVFSVRDNNILSVEGYLFEDIESKKDWEANVKNARTPIYLSGWLVFISTDYWVILLRNQRAAESVLYISLALPKRYADSKRISEFYVLECNGIIEPLIHDFRKVVSYFSDGSIKNKIHKFQRLVDFSCGKTEKVGTMKSDKTVQSVEERQRIKKAAIRENFGQPRFKATEPENLIARESYEMEEYEFENKNLTDEAKKAFIAQRKEEARVEQLGLRLIYAASMLNGKQVRDLISIEGAPINYQSPQSGCTTIHFFAVYERWDEVQFLLDKGQCDLLIRDRNGRLLSRAIAQETDNVEWAKKIEAIELEQGRAKGVIPRGARDIPIVPDEP
jgi:hypothetical protein